MRSQEDIKKDCENLFQGGASRIIEVHPTGWGLRSSLADSGRRAVQLAEPGYSVYQRRKLRGGKGYGWVLVGISTQP